MGVEEASVNSLIGCAWQSSPTSGSALLEVQLTWRKLGREEFFRVLGDRKKQRGRHSGHWGHDLFEDPDGGARKEDLVD